MTTPASPVRVRFAPSPTGSLHIGGARTALFNYLYARASGGVFILRIEDTDQARNTPEALQTIFDGLKWLGIAWDEGPIHQSHRGARYREEADRLIAAGRAFRRDDPGKGTAVVFSIDREYIEWDDAVHGKIGRDISKDPDLVIIKSDGSPTYNFACVVDDADMTITHVIRGDDHVANTPKQISLYRALGKPIPRFAHIPLILNPDGSKMSKDYKKKFPGGKEETVPTALPAYKEMGVLPEAMVNFLSLLGWAPGDDREILSPEELRKIFTLERINNHGAQFNIEKLHWMNGAYLRAKPLDELVRLTRPILAKSFDLASFSEEKIREAVGQQHERIKTLSEIADLTRFVFAREIAYDPKAVDKILKKEGVGDNLRAAAEMLRASSFDPATIEVDLQKLAEARNAKLKDIAQPLRVAVTGSTVSPPINETLHILGRETVLARIDAALKMIA